MSREWELMLIEEEENSVEEMGSKIMQDDIILLCD